MLIVSVIIATYNSSKTIQRALKSVFAQNGLNDKFELQVIVVDDCSTDNSVEIIKQFCVDFFENPINSGGPNRGRNLALGQVKGDYITFLDHDDEWLPNKVESQLDAIIDEKIVTSGYVDVEIKNNKRRNFVNRTKNKIIRYSQNETFFSKLSRSKKSQITYFGSIMIHKDLGNIFFEEKFGMVDYDWILKIFENQKSVEVVEPLFIRYVNNSNLSLNEKYRKNDFHISSNIINEYASKFSIKSKLGIKRLNSSMGRYYYLVGDVEKARSYFLNGEFTIVTFLYFITSFIGREFVVKNFKVFG